MHILVHSLIAWLGYTILVVIGVITSIDYYIAITDIVKTSKCIVS